MCNNQSAAFKFDFRTLNWFLIEEIAVDGDAASAGRFVCGRSTTSPPGSPAGQFGGGPVTVHLWSVDSRRSIWRRTVPLIACLHVTGRYTHPSSSFFFHNEAIPMRWPTARGLVSALALAIAGTSAVADDQHGRDSDDIHHVRTATPIKHAIVIFQENVSFDHYFGTYPKALNLSGETPFTASQHTPKVNNLANPLDVNRNFGPLE